MHFIYQQLTHHNKWKLFLLDISFLGWKCLSFLTLGVLDIVFVNPYIACTKAELYMILRRNYVLSRSPLYEKLNDAALEHVLSEDELLISKASMTTQMDLTQKLPILPQISTLPFCTLSNLRNMQ